MPTVKQANFAGGRICHTERRGQFADPLTGSAKLMTSHKIPIHIVAATMVYKTVINLNLGLALAALVTSCVSIGFRPPTPIKSESVKFSAPPAPFKKTQSPHVDSAWQDTASGGTISFLSDCQNPTDPSLQNILKGVTSQLESVAFNFSNTIEYNSREALHSSLDGKVDGVPTRLELVVFKKNSCIYILTYAAAAPAFGLHQRLFANFVKEFKAP